METISSIIRGDLPPVGRPIHYLAPSDEVELPVFEGYVSYWVDSGTSALALALFQAKISRPEVERPEVILPGYCCPDLVAAAHYAGVIPRVVDINRDDPAMNLPSLRESISEETIAVVAINFLGIAENIQALVELKSEFPWLAIVEDNAQWFPSQNEENLLMGDFVTFSFGRGKPVSLLGGGLLLSKHSISQYLVEQHIAQPVATTALARFIILSKYAAYNVLLSPFLYRFLNRNPFIRLGETQYHELRLISAMDAVRQKLLCPNICEFEKSSTSLEDKYKMLFDSVGFENKFAALESLRRRRLLRYPVLFSTVEDKSRVMNKLISMGLGATEMYRTALPDVHGVAEIRVDDRLENARAFASRFITLPVHSGVQQMHLDLITVAFRS